MWVPCTTLSGLQNTLNRKWLRYTVGHTKVRRRIGSVSRSEFASNLTPRWLSRTTLAASDSSCTPLMFYAILRTAIESKRSMNEGSSQLGHPWAHADRYSHISAQYRVRLWWGAVEIKETSKPALR